MLTVGRPPFHTAAAPVGGPLIFEPERVCDLARGQEWEQQEHDDPFVTVPLLVSEDNILEVGI